MICFLAAYWDEQREIKISSFEFERNSEFHALGYIIETLKKRNWLPIAVFLLEGSGYTDNEYDLMIETKNFPPFEILFVDPELLAAYNSMECSNELMVSMNQWRHILMDR